MALEVKVVEIGNVTALDSWLWTAAIDPREITRLLGDCRYSYGGPNVILLSKPPVRVSNSQLQFAPADARPLNIGAQFDTLIIWDAESSADKAEDQTDTEASLGDLQFVASLPAELEQLGKTFLAAIRKQFKGRLEYHSKSRKYVERPDNWWTVIIQPRARSLRVIVRGKPEEFDVQDGVRLSQDQHGYANFTIARVEDVPKALAILQQAKRK